MVKEIEIYTDGSSRKTGVAGWAFAIEISDQKIFAHYGHLVKHSTNNIAEMTAVLEALKMFDGHKEYTLSIFTDSQYVQKGITVWRENWEKRGLRNNTGDFISNHDLWISIFNYWDRRQEGSEIYWVRGHCGNKMNEIADKLANFGSDNKIFPVNHPTIHAKKMY